MSDAGKWESILVEKQVESSSIEFSQEYMVVCYLKPVYVYRLDGNFLTVNPDFNDVPNPLLVSTSNRLLFLKSVGKSVVFRL